MLDLNGALAEIERFVDSSVRRLDEAGVTGTLLQDEWAAIQSADSDEQEFCLVAAAWGLDPYNISPKAADTLEVAGRAVPEPGLLADLARVVDIPGIPDAQDWLADAMGRIRVAERNLPALSPVAFRHDERPWLQGYRRAAELREQFGLALTDRLPVEELVAIVPASDAPPTRIDALVSVDAGSAGIVVAPQASTRSQRFTAARALGRRSIEGRVGYSLITPGNQYSDQVERAFAAELLAPAAGISTIVGDEDYWSEATQRRAADHFGVNPLLIEHQIENQIAA